MQYAPLIGLFQMFLILYSQKLGPGNKASLSSQVSHCIWLEMAISKNSAIMVETANVIQAQPTSNGKLKKKFSEIYIIHLN